MSRERYIAAKQRWAEKQIARGVRPLDTASSSRLPPGQTLTTGFPVLDLGIQPEIPLSAWKLTLGGLAENPVALDWAAFNALPQVEDTSDFHCVTTWSKYDCRWSGVAFTTLYELARPAARARFVYFTGYDGYSTNVPFKDLTAGKAMVALQYEGRPISPDHGGPARLLVPHLYFWKSAKWINALQFTEKDTAGFWELRGYHIYGDPFKEQRYSYE